MLNNKKILKADSEKNVLQIERQMDGKTNGHADRGSDPNL